MRPLLVVHVGAIKAATTSIQVALAAGYAPRGALRLLYPCKSLNHNYLETSFRRTAAPEEAKILALRHALQSEPADIAVLSAERFSALAPQRLKQVIESCFGDLISGYKILHYIRPHAEQALSGYAEMVKIGRLDQPLETYLETQMALGRWRQLAKLQRWQRVFGPRYQLRPMLRRAMVQGDAVADFFATVLGDLPETWQTPPQVNESLPPQGLAEVARMQRCLSGEDPDLRHVLGYDFAAAYAVGLRGAQRRAPAPDPAAPPIQGKLGMTPEIAARFLASYRADALALDRGFFDGAHWFETALERQIARAELGVSAPLLLPQQRFAAGISQRLLARIATKTAEEKRAYIQHRRRHRFQLYLDHAKSALLSQAPEPITLHPAA